MHALGRQIRIVAACLGAAAILVLPSQAVGGNLRSHRAHAVAASIKHKRRHHRRRHHRPTHRAAPAKPAQCANANAAATSTSLDQLRTAVVCLINQQRTSRGLPALSVSSLLNQSAQGWTNVMVVTSQFTHGVNFAARISAVGYDWQTAGENIATGFMTPAQVVEAWMASADHCRNILDPSFRDVGTGENPAPVASFASGPATWTQDFGLLMSQSAPSTDHGPQNGCPY